MSMDLGRGPAGPDTTTPPDDAPTSEVPVVAAPAAPSGGEAIMALRRKPRNLHLAGGFGPLLVGVVLFLLMLWAAPSVAPEHVVERPATTSTTAVTTTTANPPSTVAKP